MLEDNLSDAPTLSLTALVGPDNTPLDAGTAGGYGPLTDAGTYTLSDGAAVSEEIDFIYQGVLPGFAAAPPSQVDSTGAFLAPSGLVFTGDSFNVLGVASCPGTDVLVTNLGPSGAPDLDKIQASPIAAGCESQPFNLFAGATKPFVSYGSLSGYLGRVGPNDVLTYAGSYKRHPETFNAAAPQYNIPLGGLDPALVRGARYVLTTKENFEPSRFFLDSATYAGYLLPGAVIYWQDRRPAVTQVDRIFVGYPARNSVVQFDPGQFFPGQPNVEGATAKNLTFFPQR